MSTNAEIVLKDIKTKGLMISRVPEIARSEFIDLSTLEFAGDYGMALKHLLDHYKLFQYVITNFDSKLDKIIHILESSGSGEKTPTEGIKLLNGRIIEKEVQK